MLQRLFQHTQQQGRGQGADSQRNQKARRVFHDRQQKQPAVRRGTPAAQQNRYEPGQCTACDAGEADPQRIAQCKRQRTLGHEGRAHQQRLRRRAALGAGEPRREQQAGQPNAQRRNHAARHDSGHQVILLVYQCQRAADVGGLVDRPAVVGGHHAAQQRAQHQTAAALHPIQLDGKPH